MNREHVRLVPLDAPPWLDPQVQFRFAVNPANALAVPGMPADIAQIQEAQAKVPRSVRLGQAFEKIRDGLVLGTAPWAVAKADLADPEGPQASAMLSPFVATALAANSRR